jgi:hypothetical protein
MNVFSLLTIGAYITVLTATTLYPQTPDSVHRSAGFPASIRADSVPVREGPSHGLSDSVYRLAVNPAEHPEDNAILLLDESVTHISNNGHRSQTVRQVVQILTQEAAQAWGEYTIGYVSSRQTLVINRARVVKLNGTVISDKPVVEQESNAGVDDNAPIYTDGKVHRMSLGGGVPGTIVDIMYTIVDTAPIMSNDYFSVINVTRQIPVRQSHIVINAPISLNLTVEERNMPVHGQKLDVGGRRIMTWTANDIDVPTAELFSSDSNDMRHARLIMSSPVTWNDVAAWYAKLATGRYALDSVTRAKVAQVENTAKTRDDSLHALYRWIAQDLRYVSLSFGIGGYQPRMPASVLETQYGDCKDKTTLFIAAARAMGVDAYPVLVSSGGGIFRNHPSASQFNHVIAAVKRETGQHGYTFLDLTADLTPYSELPFAYQGSSVLVIHDDGLGELVTLPPVTPTENVYETHIVGSLSPTGAFTGYVTEDGRGARQYLLRGMAITATTTEDRQRIVRDAGASIFAAGVGDSLVITGGRDLLANAHVAFALHSVQATSSAGTTQLLTFPFHGSQLKSVIETLRDERNRKSWIDVGQVSGYGGVTQELLITLPPGWKATLPVPITVDGIFGSFHTAYTQHGRNLHVVRRMMANTGVQPPIALPALIAWLEQIARDDVKFIALKKP